jgi:hypothetical protein
MSFQFVLMRRGLWLLLTSILVTVNGFADHKKLLTQHPLCTNILYTKSFQAQHIALRRSPEYFLRPVLNLSSPYADLPCYSVSIHSNNITYQSLVDLIENLDQDESVRRIILVTHANHSNLHHLNQIIDQIIIPRPWWRIQEHENHQSLHVTLDKISREWEHHIRFIGSIQYPPPEICRETPLIVGKEDCIHPGWGAVFGMYGSLNRIFPFSILAPYVSISNDPLENTAFIKGSDCPNELNKWNCAFLPTTNCSLPSLVTDCRTDHCIPPVNYDAGALYTHAAPDGELINLREATDEIRLKYQTEIHSPLSKELASKQYFIHPQFKYTMPFNRTWYEIMKDDVHDAYAEHAGFNMYLLLRMNSWYRSQVSHYIRSYRASTSPYLHPNAECVAIHIRRGDRTSNHNIQEVCYNASHEPKLCLDENNQLHPCGVHDMHCGNVPFGSIELPRTLQTIDQILPPKDRDSSNGDGNGDTPRNILLFSDDYDWIQRETEAIKQNPSSPYHHWNFYHPPPPSSLTDTGTTTTAGAASKYTQAHANLQKYHMIRSDGGTASGIYLQATFQMVSQCNGFIGHFGSSFTGLLFAIMCHRHRGLEGVCPPMFDIKWDREYYDRLEEEYAAVREGRRESSSNSNSKLRRK